MSTTPRATPIPDSHIDILTSRPTAYLATVRPDGMLSVNPVAVMWDGQHLRVSTVKTRKKVRNLEHDPRVAIAIAHRNNPNLYVEVRGTAELADDTDRSFVDAMAQVYMGVDRYPFDRPGDERVTITIHATQVSAPRIPLADDPPTAPDPPT